MKQVGLHILLSLSALAIGCSPVRVDLNTETVVAITQIQEHPALNLEREGILEALKEAGYVEGKNLKIIYQNSQGNVVLAAQGAQKLISLNPNVIVAISTPSAQAALSAIGEKNIPLIFSAVTDPIGARLISGSHRKVTGVTDYLPPEPQLKLLKDLVPQVKKVGVIYNPGESNSVKLYQELKKAAPKFSIELIPVTATRTSEVATAAQSLVGRVNALYIPNDNTAVTAMESIVQVGIKNQLPVFAGDIGSLQRGAVAVAGYNRKQMGIKAGKQVVEILKGKSPSEIQIENQHIIEITLNRDSATRMGLQLPEANGGLK
jgi:putative ABC transport system substrate-binding protein